MLNSTDICTIEEKIGYVFLNKDLLSRAFVHSSYANLKRIDSYERFEFLGDSLLNFVVAEKLFSNFSSKQEGELTHLRQRIVEGKNLSAISQKLRLESYVSVVKNVAVSVDILEDVFEAIIASIYLDGGFEKAKDFILRVFENQLNKADGSDSKDYKSIVNERYAKNKVEYKCRPCGDEFEVQLFIDEKQVAKSTARNKEMAEKQCAEQLVGK